MKSVWIAGTSDKEARTREVLSYRNAFEDLTEVLKRHYKKKDAVRDYDNPNWLAKQIAVNEYNQVIDEVISLISLDKE